LTLQPGLVRLTVRRAAAAEDEPRGVDPMTTALIISELLPLYDDALIADIDAVFDAIDREVEEAREAAEQASMLLDVEWLVDEMLEDTVRITREALEISLTLTDSEAVSQASPPAPTLASLPALEQVAEVA
jgi:hypothetical protein